MRQFAGYIFDLDGTVYLGDGLIPGADQVIKGIRESGAGVAFLSNNPTRSPEEYADKLTRLGIAVEPNSIITSACVLIEELQREAQGARLVVIGEERFRRRLMRAGFSPAPTPAEADFVILAADRTLHYGKLLSAYRAVKHGARVWATNPDRTWPVEDGEIPGCGTIIGAVEACTGRKVERILGKPRPLMLELAASRLECPLTDCLVVGDRLETDILMARQSGCQSALVLTGVTTRDMLATSSIQPDYVLESMAEIR